MHDFYEFLEWLGVGLNLVFIVLIIFQKRIGWWFGILGSAVSIFVFIHAKLYSEAILYGFYVGIGFYGLAQWAQKASNALVVHEIKWRSHVFALLLCAATALGLGALFSTQSDAANPFADAFSTIFSFLATYLEAKKVLSAWLYWFVLNAFSVWLYNERGLQVYATLMLVYAALSVVGFMQWRKSYRAANFA